LATKKKDTGLNRLGSTCVCLNVGMAFDARNGRAQTLVMCWDSEHTRRGSGAKAPLGLKGRSQDPASMQHSCVYATLLRLCNTPASRAGQDPASMQHWRRCCPEPWSGLRKQHQGAMGWRVRL